MRSEMRAADRNIVLIDAEKCVGCGLCVKDCVGEHLYIEGGVVHAKEDSCPECGHCYAVCPNSVFSFIGYDTSETVAPVDLSELDPEILLKGIKSRRSCRQYRDENVPDDIICKILEAGRYSPTASNKQDVHFTLLKDKKDEMEKIVVSYLREAKKQGGVRQTFHDRTITDQFIFKGAPLAILVSSVNPLDGGLASAYMEIMANNLGLGVLYSGYFQYVYENCDELRKIISLPDEESLVSCMVLGFPAVKYRRIVPRYSANVTVL